MGKRTLTGIALALVVASATPLVACLWDRDTLKAERQRFPTTLELITGKFLRHSQEYYQWRVEDRRKKLAAEPDNLANYDDLAVAYEKLGQHDKAIETILKKNELKPGIYETEANLGTFLIHAGRLEEGLAHIKRAIEINPDAHFGREIYQQLLVEYVLARQEDGKTTLPLDRYSGGYAWKQGFGSYVVSRRLKPRQQQNESLRRAELGRALKGVLGMMRFGNHDSPILLEALGDILLAHGRRSDAKQLAARAYLKAAYEVEEDSAKRLYRSLAEEALSNQSAPGRSSDQLPFPQLEASFKAELAEADRWFESIVKDEQAWIEQGKDVDAEFADKYYQSPAITYEARAETLRSKSPAKDMGIVPVLSLLLLTTVVAVVLFVVGSSKRRSPPADNG